MAVNQAEADKLDDLQGRNLMATLTAARNLAFHNKYFALIGSAFRMADTNLTLKQFRIHCTVGAGYCDFMLMENKGFVAIPKSISFAAMDQTEFERLYKDTISFICQRWILNRDMLNQIVEFM